MSDLAAIQAEFVQPKPMKTRPILQLVFEVPVEQAEQVMKALGWPKPGESIWCAIAKLNPPEEA